MRRRLGLISLFAVLIIGIGGLCVTSGSLALGSPAYAKVPGSGGTPDNTLKGCSDQPSLINCQTVQNVNNKPNLSVVNKIGLSLINFILFIGGALAIIFLIIGGLRYVVSVGDPAQIAGAKATIQYAIIGLLVIITAVVLVNTLVGIKI
jgi:hypothetical protein